MKEVLSKYNEIICYTNGQGPKRSGIGHGGAGVCFYGRGLKSKHKPKRPAKKIVIKGENDMDVDEIEEDLKDFIEPD